MLLENAPCVECMDKGLCFLLKHRNIIATAYWMLLVKPSFLISLGQTCWHTFHALRSAKNKRPVKCVKPKLTPLYFRSSHAWYAWLLYYKIQQFFLECVIMHECNNNFAFPSYSYIYTAILNIHCFFFPLVYMVRCLKVAGICTAVTNHIIYGVDDKDILSNRILESWQLLRLGLHFLNVRFSGAHTRELQITSPVW